MGFRWIFTGCFMDFHGNSYGFANVSGQRSARQRPKSFGSGSSVLALMEGAGVMGAPTVPPGWVLSMEMDDL